MKPGNERIDLRFNIILFAFFAVIGVLGYLGFASIRAELLNEQIAILQEKTSGVAHRVDRWLLTRKTEISTLANTPVIRSMDWKEAGPFLKAKHEQMPWFYIFAHINPDGTYYNSKVDFAKGQNLSDRSHFKASIQGRVYASDPVVSRTLGADIVAVTSPIYRTDSKGADIIGVFGGMIDTTTIVEELSRFSNGPKSYAFAVNSTGIAISHPDPKRRGNINTKALSLLQDEDPGLKALVNLMLTQKTGWLDTTIDGQRVFAAFTPISEADWTIATITDGPFVRAHLRFIDYVGAFAFLVLCLAVWLVLRFRRQEFQTLNQRREISEEKSRAKSVFLANMSHELRTPLNGILGYAQILLQRDGADPTVRRHIQAILSSGQHLLNMINRILDLSKIEAGRIELEPRPVDLPSLLQDLVRLFDIEKSKYGASFAAEFSLGQHAVAVLDPERFKQIVINLVVNGFKYGRQSLVQLSVAVREDQRQPVLVMQVSDGGIGMSAEQVSQAFVPFEQVNKTSEGAGLGLAIVSELVSLMGGAITIDSTPGQGTRVSVTLPFEAAAPEMAVLMSSERGMPCGLLEGRPRILVVDDNPTNVQFLVDLLQMVGFEVQSAEGVTQALAAHAQRPFDLVITDLVMPDRDGFDLIRAIRSGTHAPHTPIIVASASAFAGDQVRSTAAGANAFVPKPVESLTLLQKIAGLLKIEYRYAQTPSEAPASSQGVQHLREALGQPQARALVQDIRDAAELGQVRRVEALIGQISDTSLQRALLDALGVALKEQDSELLLKRLDEALGEAA
jgi:signal transduction histidine kinase/DNA-binding response OmpR family regulator